MCADPEIWKALKAPPEGANSIEWPIEQVRANEAAARIFWPLGNTRIEKRLRLIKAPTLLLWGEQDRIMPRGYADVSPTASPARPRHGSSPAPAIWPNWTSRPRSHAEIVGFLETD